MDGKILVGYVLVHRGALAWVTDKGPKDTIYATPEDAKRDACIMCDLGEVWMLQ